MPEPYGRIWYRTTALAPDTKAFGDSFSNYEDPKPAGARCHPHRTGRRSPVDYGSGPMVRDPQSGKYRRTGLFVITHPS